MNVNNLSIAEQLYFTTVKISTDNNSCGTGFFFSFNINGINVPTLVTNNHVVQGSMSITIRAHTAPVNDEVDLTRFYDITLITSSCIVHPVEDLCIFPLGKEQCNIFFKFFNEQNLPTQADIESTDFLEEVLMLGCPDGIFDDYNNIPLLRRGITATPMSLDFKNTKRFLTDIAAFPGSSGSPILIYDRASRTDKLGNIHLGSGRRLHLIGIHAAGYMHQINSDWHGQLPLGTPTPVSLIPNSLGVAIKSSCLLDFKPIMAQILAVPHATSATPNDSSST